MEQIDLILPITKETITNWKVSRLELDWTNARIEIHLIFASTGEKVIFGYNGVTATNLMRTMNTKNFSVTSIHKTLFQKLVNDGYISGNISGSPD